MTIHDQGRCNAMTPDARCIRPYNHPGAHDFGATADAEAKAAIEGHEAVKDVGTPLTPASGPATSEDWPEYRKRVSAYPPERLVDALVREAQLRHDLQIRVTDLQARAKVPPVGSPPTYSLTADECRLLAFKGAVAATKSTSAATALEAIYGEVEDFLGDRS